MRELTGSKGRAALGSGIIAIATALLASLKTLDPSVAVALILTLGVVAVAYIWATGHEDGKKAEVERVRAEASQRPPPLESPSTPPPPNEAA